MDDNVDDSGPFCRHWSHPADCDEPCATCGHLCCQHTESGCAAADESACVCACGSFVTPERS